MNNKPYILSADDNPMNQIIITEMLQNYFEVECINTGQEFLSSLAIRLPDIIIIGESMPITDVSESRKILRTDSRFKEIPIIVTFFEAFIEETDVYLSKPFNKDQLISCINQLLYQSEITSDLNHNPDELDKSLIQ